MLSRLRDITGEIASRQEKALVFTQFRETAAPLAAFLSGHRRLEACADSRAGKNAKPGLRGPILR